MSKLSVYKASAGSGKTFRLTIEYLKVVLKQPSHYKRILAITFTNKATAEMKSRILEQLHDLAIGKATAYQTILTEELELSNYEIQERAKQAEQYILHDYSRFSVMTIDAFFQTILKAFAKELGVAYNYNVELDTERIKQLAVERMFEELDENDTLRRWLQSYVADKINDGRSWNITKDILALSQELFQEEIFLLDDKKLKQWSEKAFVRDFSKKLQRYMQSYATQLQQLGKQAMTKIDEAGLYVEDFSYKQKGVAGLFQKIAEGNLVVEITSSYHHKPVDNIEAWYSKTLKTDVKQRIEMLYPELNDLLKQIHEIVEVKGRLFQSCKMVSKNLYMMGIFSDIGRHIHNVLHEEEKMLLSESNKLLYEMIADNDVPFIYEKTGNHYLYFLWDEFQDTSQIQWHNLKPLLSNALAEGNPCLIVGDIKQAIYRWRNSDWKILGEEVSKEFPFLESSSMQQNWRSDGRIVQFNNELYRQLPQLLDRNVELEEEKSITSLYEDVEQEAAALDKKNEGFVNFSYLEVPEQMSDEDAILDVLPSWVEKVQGNGVKPEDIVFLVRKNSEAVAIADFFANIEERKAGINYDVVSEYALLLQNSFVVKVLVNALYFQQSRELYYETFLEQLADYLPSGKEKQQQWKEFVEREKCNVSLESLVQQAIRVFSLHTLDKEQLYLMAFEEFVNTYIHKHNNSLSDFLADWENKKHSLSVTPGERIPAMRVMTVHKAKGLEFHTVMIPFAHKNLDTYRNGENFWQQASVAPLDDVGPLLIPFVKKELLNSHFSEAYKKEMQQRYIDELNIFYVATTRAVSNLILIAPEKKTGLRITTLLYDLIAQDSSQENFWSQHWDEDTREWSYGAIVASQSLQEVRSNTYAQQQLYYYDYLDRFPLSISQVDDAKRETVDSLTPIEDGKIWHRLLEGVRYAEDIPIVVRRAYYAGLITKNAQQNYETHLQELLDRSTIRDFYTDSYKILNERPLWANGETYVPDRVVYNDDEVIVIDYKFGESQNTSHQRQVKKYLSFFEKKGYKVVKGYLIYGIFSKIVAV